MLRWAVRLFQVLSVMFLRNLFLVVMEAVLVGLLVELDPFAKFSGVHCMQ